MDSSRTALHIAAIFSGGQGEQNYALNIRAGNLRRFDKLNRSGDCLETFRILIENGQYGPMAKTRIGFSNPWHGSSALHMFTGVTATFDYLLNNQDKFVIDLHAQNSLDMSVHDTQLYHSWANSAANGRLSLHTVADIQQSAKGNNLFSLNGMVYLHHAVSKMQWYQGWEGNDPTQPYVLDEGLSNHENIKFNELLIVDLLNAGADIHASSVEGQTP
jgi:hypothetical protein